MRPLVVFLAIAFGWGTFALAAPKDVPKLPIPPPQPVPQKVSVGRDGVIEIPLKIYGRQAEVLRFQVRTPPARGKLTPVTATGRESATVRYTPPADLSVKTDKFAYAVQNSAGVSAPADVIVEIVDDPMRLIVPDTVRFERILAGATARQLILIRNEGGGRAEGELKVAPPWKIEGDPAYRLGHADEARFIVVFAPTVSGPARTEVRYTSHPDRVTVLEGEAQAPLTIQPAILTLQNTPGDPTRSGAVEITNHTEQIYTVQLPRDERWRLPPTLTIPAGGQEILLVKLAPEDVKAIREELTIVGEGVSLKVPVEAAEVPPILKANSPTLSLPLKGAAEVTVRNVGGRIGHWRIEAPESFSVSPLEVSLPARGTAAVSVRLETAEVGQYNASIRFIGDKQTVEVAVDGEVRPMITNSAPTRSGSPAGSVPVLSSAPAPPPPPETGQRLPPVEDSFLRGTRPGAPFRLLEITTSTITVEWPEKVTSGQTVRAELLSVGLDAKRRAQEIWTEHKEASFTPLEGQMRLTLRRLTPKTRYFARIVATHPDSPEPLLFYEFNFATKPAEAGWLRPVPLLITAALLCGGVFIWQYRKRRAVVS